MQGIPAQNAFALTFHIQTAQAMGTLPALPVPASEQAYDALCSARRRAAARSGLCVLGWVLGVGTAQYVFSHAESENLKSICTAFSAAVTVVGVMAARDGVARFINNHPAIHFPRGRYETPAAHGRAMDPLLFEHATALAEKRAFAAASRDACGATAKLGRTLRAIGARIHNRPG